MYVGSKKVLKLDPSAKNSPTGPKRAKKRPKRIGLYLQNKR